MTLAKSFYMGALLRRYAYGNQFGAKGAELQSTVRNLMVESDAVLGSNIKGSMATDVFQLLENMEPDEDQSFEGGEEVARM